MPSIAASLRCAHPRPEFIRHVAYHARQFSYGATSSMRHLLAEVTEN